MKHVIGISGGKDSTCLALRLAEVEPRNYELLITPVGNELPEMHAHWERLEGILGKKFVRLKPFGETDGLVHLIRFFGALPNWRQRWCTRMLKIEPTIAYLRAHAPATQFVGLRADEDVNERTGIYGEIPGVTQRFPLREWGYGLKEVWAYLKDRGISVPRRTDCAWCYGQRLIEWKRLWEEHPEVYAQAEAMETETGHTFRSAKRDTWPARLSELRAEFERGRKVRGEKTVVPAASKPGCVALDLFDWGEAQHQPCRACSL